MSYVCDLFAWIYIIYDTLTYIYNTNSHLSICCMLNLAFQSECSCSPPLTLLSYLCHHFPISHLVMVDEKLLDKLIALCCCTHNCLHVQLLYALMLLCPPSNKNTGNAVTVIKEWQDENKHIYTY